MRCAERPALGLRFNLINNLSIFLIVAIVLSTLKDRALSVGDARWDGRLYLTLYTMQVTKKKNGARTGLNFLLKQLFKLGVALIAVMDHFKILETKK